MANDPPSGSAQARADARWTRNPTVAPETDVSNSRFATSYWSPDPRVGVDTVSWCWSDAEGVDRLMRLDGLVHDKDDPRPLRVVPAPAGSVRLNRRLDGLGQVGAFPGASMLYLEGRADALHRADETHHGLAAPRQLPDTLEQASGRLSALLGRSLGPPALRRVDLAGELCFDQGEDGRDLLRLLDALHSPNHKTAPVRERGGSGLETVYWRTPKRSVPVLRAYDKGVESQTAAAGERIRLERQVRYSGRQRPSMSQFLTRDLAALYVAPIRRWFCGGIAAGTADELLRLLTDAAVIWPNYWSSGSSWCSSTGREHTSLWPARKVERVIGTLGIVASYGRAWPAWTFRQRRRRMAEVRDLGLLLLDEPPRVDVDREVGRLCQAWANAA